MQRPRSNLFGDLQSDEGIHSVVGLLADKHDVGKGVQASAEIRSLKRGRHPEHSSRGLASDLLTRLYSTIAFLLLIEIMIKSDRRRGRHEGQEIR